jgi:hypothetical protein
LSKEIIKEENDIVKRLLEEKQVKMKGGLYHYTQVKFAYNSPYAKTKF